MATIKRPIRWGRPPRPQHPSSSLVRCGTQRGSPGPPWKMHTLEKSRYLQGPTDSWTGSVLISISAITDKWTNDGGASSPQGSSPPGWSSTIPRALEAWPPKATNPLHLGMGPIQVPSSSLSQKASVMARSTYSLKINFTGMIFLRLWPCNPVLNLTAPGWFASRRQPPEGAPSSAQPRRPVQGPNPWGAHRAIPMA
jgi:hypothetical protein